MISNASIEEYARLAHLFRKALDESYAESKLKNYPIFSLFPQGTCGDCSCLLSRFIVEHNLPEPTYIAGERADGSTHAWLEIHDTIIDITHDQFGTLPAVYISNYDIPNTYLGFKIKNRNFVANGEYDYYNAYLEEVYQSWQRLFRAAHHPDRLRGYYPDGRNHDRGTDRDHIGHRAGLCSERGVSAHRPDERHHVRAFPGAETRPERHQPVRKCDERCHFPEMAFPLMLVSWYSVLGRRHLLKNFFRETIFLPLQQSKLV